MLKVLVSYDLLLPGQNYSGLIQAIKNLGDAFHVLESTWVVRTNLKSCAEVRDRLTPHIDRNDRLLVVGLSGDWATWNVQTAGLQN